MRIVINTTYREIFSITMQFTKTVIENHGQDDTFSIKGISITIEHHAQPLRPLCMPKVAA